MSAKRNRKKAKVNYAADARAIGCTRQHLRYVLIGQRVADPTLQAWLALEQQRHQPTQPIPS